VTISSLEEVTERGLVYVVNEQEPAIAESRPNRLHLEPHIANGMKAVMNEDVDRSKLMDQLP